MQQLRVLAVLAETWVQIPGPPRQLMTIYNSNCRRSDALVWSLKESGTCMLYIQQHGGKTLIHISGREYGCEHAYYNTLESERKFPGSVLNFTAESWNWIQILRLKLQALFQMEPFRLLQVQLLDSSIFNTYYHPKVFGDSRSHPRMLSPFCTMEWVTDKQYSYIWPSVGESLS